MVASANQYARDVERIDADNSVDSTDTSGLTRKERKDRKKTRLDKIHQIKEGALNKLMESVYKHIPVIYCTCKVWIFQSTRFCNT
jgi:hypothetical protein